jgi:hypothetical protein
VSYRRTQDAVVPWFIGSVVVATLVGASLAADSAAVRAGVLGAAVLVTVLVMTFSRLVVSVDGDAVRAAFGTGWPRRTIALTEVLAVRAVRTRWWHGWGIRWIPRGSLWNVRGFDAVELVLGSGGVVRFGTDDPNGLAAAIEAAAGIS